MNVVLIGMPGCGKSTIGHKLAQKLGAPEIDLDLEIEKAAGMSIPEIFERFGERHFRDMEQEAAVRAAKADNSVVITGGGIVLREANMAALGRTGRVVLIDRPLSAIACDIEMGTRPLLKDGPQKLYELYEQRSGLYRKYADIIIENIITVDETVEKIAAAILEGGRVT